MIKESKKLNYDFHMLQWNEKRQYKYIYFKLIHKKSLRNGLELFVSNCKGLKDFEDYLKENELKLQLVYEIDNIHLSYYEIVKYDSSPSDGLDTEVKDLIIKLKEERDKQIMDIFDMNNAIENTKQNTNNLDDLDDLD